MKPRLFDIIVVILLVINLLLTAILLDNNTASDPNAVFDEDIRPSNAYSVSSTGVQTIVYTDIDDLLEIIEDQEIIDSYRTMQVKYAELNDKTLLKDDLESFQDMLFEKGFTEAAAEMPRVIEATETDDIYIVDSAVAIVLYEVVIQQ